LEAELCLEVVGFGFPVRVREQFLQNLKAPLFLSDTSRKGKLCSEGRLEFLVWAGKQFFIPKKFKGKLF
jgi:hypothetical protein